jgi:hypothetical protein
VELNGYATNGLVTSPHHGYASDDDTEIAGGLLSATLLGIALGLAIVWYYR